MGVRYHNITLQGVTQQELADYLKQFHFDCYISPTVNGFTVLYEIATLSSNSSLGFLFRDSRSLHQSIQKVAQFDRWMRQYQDSYLATLVCLSSHLSAVFSCSVLAVFADEDCMFWYHLSRSGAMIDEYTTSADRHWQPGRGIKDFSVRIPQGGDPYKLASAFDREEAVQDLQMILRKPQLFELCLEQGQNRYSALLNMRSYCCLTRHEAIARALGMRPCWVVGLDYLCCEGSGDFEAHYGDQMEDIDPPLDEAINLIRHISV